MIINTVLLICIILTLALTVFMVRTSVKTAKGIYILSMAIISLILGSAMTITMAGMFTIYEAGHPRILTESFVIGEDAVYTDEKLITTSLGIERKYDFPKLKDLNMTSEDIQGIEVKVDTFVYDFGVLTKLFKLDTTRHVVRIE